jgi:large subunit ribosomal protein L10
MAKAEKVEKVATLKERIEGSEALLLADFRGLTVVETKDLRTSLREADAAFAVVKNTLMKRAAEASGMDVLDPLLEGPTAVAFVRGDAVLAAKRLSEATRRFPTLEIKGGFMEGRLLSADDAKALAKLDSREAMLAQIAGMAKAEMSRAASMFQALQSRFLGVLEAFREKVPGEPEAEPEAAAEAEPPAEAEAEPPAEEESTASAEPEASAEPQAGEAEAPTEAAAGAEAAVPESEGAEPTVSTEAPAEASSGETSDESTSENDGEATPPAAEE